MLVKILLALVIIGSIQAFLIKFEEDSDQKKFSYAQYNSRFILPDFSMTICLRFNLYSETGDYNWLFGYSIELNPDKMNMYLNHTSRELVFCLSGSRGFENCFKYPYQAHLIRQRWFPVCLVLSGLDPNTEFAKIQTWADGKLIGVDEFTTILDPEKDGQGILILAQEQDSFGEGFDKKQSFVGSIAQFNIFERELSKSEIQSFSSCQSDPRGDLVSWQTSRWTLAGLTNSQNFDYTKFCELSFKDEVIMIPDTVPFDEAAFKCEIYSVNDEKYKTGALYEAIKSELDLDKSFCSLPSGEFSMWLGNVWDFDIDKAGNWTEYKTGQQLDFDLQTIKTPSNPEEVCLTNEFGQFRPRKCNGFSFCAFCKKQPVQKTIAMKGFCDEVYRDKIFDIEYYPDGLLNKRIFFRPGLGDSVERNGNWIIQSNKNSADQLILDQRSSRGYPFGRYSWRVGDNTSFCGAGPGQLLSLTLTSCPSEMFTCKSGGCIPLANKCNSRVDCQDGSDELSCSYLQIPEVYANQLSPSSRGTDPLLIYINVTILALPSIKTVDLQFTADYYINMRWYDRRLLFKDLNDNSILNGVNTGELLTLWTPELQFLNALGPFQTVVDDLNVCTILYESPPTYDDITESVECKKELLEYEIQMWDFYLINVTDASEAEIRIVFRRNIEYHIFGTFLQQTALLAVGYLTFYFELTDFTDRVMVSLTLMLVIVTIVSSIQMTLPVTPYLKLIDIWLLFCTNMMVFSLIFHTYVETIIKPESHKDPADLDGIFFTSRKNSKWDNAPARPKSSKERNKIDTEKHGDKHIKDKQMEKAEKFNRYGKIGYVLVMAIFYLGFWIVAFWEFMRPAEEYINRGLRR